MRIIIALFGIGMTSYAAFAQDTELKLYRPFGEAVQQAPVVIKEEVTGQCFQQSQRIKREDAWRCIAAGKVYDPCFVKPYGSHREAVCPQSPWEGESVKISLSSAVDNSQHAPLNMAETYPWAIELITGEKCQAVDGGGIYDNLPIHYQCDTKAILLGRLQRCRTEWSILQRTPSGVSTALVAKAWF
ncbi:hypothetical protein [Legionella jamestowniensis]|uniref:Uncharacterized protein n=1 Tax=Legionella jamestowniensis TaxID=455 RepID=A0A0W0UGV0_9GAMM|nr:hypothetical protein [Legionella jamestowniensis]KTD06877.1 hypothetical protein Ljam_1072 [Legionella jamestowniensis]OCH97621.1 hypothetical protein A8135_14105 [Legionella jamestowniensis]SFL81882.1 hypothetical protein SAMN02746073_2040 [Legionella jamestowniensis DSM 19215]